MRCAITGHTSGIGKAFFEHFEKLGWQVEGYSRSNGYSLPDKLDDVVEKISGADLFINSSYALGNQEELVRKLCRRVKKIVVCNTISKDYPMADALKDDYVNTKKKLYNTCSLLTTNIDTSIADILTLKLAFMQEHTGDIEKPKEITSDYVISFDDVIRAVNFWIENPIVTEIGFKWKLTPRVYGSMIRATLPDTQMAKDFKMKVENL